MTEKIENVTLDLSMYSGKDLYSDGNIEDILLNIVQNHTVDEFEEIIKKENSWAILYHLSELRQNIINWYPFSKEDKVLEIGSGCGAITRAIAEKVNKVVAVELSKKRSLINAYRNRKCSNLQINVGNFNDIYPNINDKYNYVTLIGVFEYADSYIGGRTPHADFLNKINSLLTDDGKVLIAIENRFGLKYFAGCKEDHLGKYFVGIEGYSSDTGVKTFNKNEIENMLLNNGYTKYKFYYPYPDYKFPTAIYSDDYLPVIGSLSNNMRNFDTDRFVFFDETKTFDSIINSNMFDVFSNSFFVEVSKKES